MTRDILQKCAVCFGGDRKGLSLLFGIKYTSTLSCLQANSMDSLKNDTNGEEYVEFSKALEGETVEGLLGKPAWRHEALPEARFTTLAQFEGALADWGRVIQQHHVEHDFNMFGDYLQFYRDYSAVTKKNPIDFYRTYEAKINPKLMNCTGLNSTLLRSLKESDPEFSSYFALISSEETQVDTNSGKKYEFACANVVKRHVLICLKFFLSLSMGDRKGCVLADSGYSLTRPIVVMRDSVYPHTGWFVAWRRDKIEQRNYKFVNARFVQYEHRYISQATGEIHLKSNIINLIYVEREYLSYECLSLKRYIQWTSGF